MFPMPTARQATCLLLLSLMTACQKAGDGNREAPVNTVQPVENAGPAVPLPQPPMDRGALLDAVAQARSAAAAGLNDRQVQKALDGKAFEVRIRFGCAGAAQPDEEKSPLSWSFDSSSGVLRVRAAPDLSEDAAVAKGLQGVEAVEGFWLPRPWLLEAACPPKPPAPVNAAAKDEPSVGAEAATATAAATALKVGIAQFFTATDPRTTRRDHRPYRTVQKREPGAPVGTQGFDLVLSGRLRMLPEGRVIRCVASGPDAPPACVVSAQFDHVWIDDAATKERIADWSSS